MLLLDSPSTIRWDELAGVATASDSPTTMRTSLDRGSSLPPSIGGSPEEGLGKAEEG
jgi:hypothetical protein